MKYALEHIEKFRKGQQPFSEVEIRQILSPGRFNEYYQENKELIDKSFGDGNALPADEFRKALEERLNTMHQLVFFKQLEENLTTKIEKTIVKNTTNVRMQVGKLLEMKGVFNDTIIQKIRNSRTQDILSGELSLDEKMVNKYIEFVREEVKIQLSQLKYLDTDAPDIDAGQLRDIYEKSGKMMDFIVFHAETSPADQGYLKASLLKKLRSKGGFKFILDLYTEMEPYFLNEDSDKCKNKIKELTNRLNKQCQEDKLPHIHETISQYARDISMDDAEIKELLDSDMRKAGDVTYNQRIGNSLHEIELRKFEMFLDKKQGKSNSQIKESHLNAINVEIKNLRDDISDFHEKKYTLEYVVKNHLAENLDDITRDEIKQAASILSSIRDISIGKKLVGEIASIQNLRQAKDFLYKADNEVAEYLIENKEFARDTLDRMKMQNPFFTAISLYTQKKKLDAATYVNKKEKKNKFGEQSGVEDTDPYVNGGALSKIQEMIGEMGKIVKRKFTHAKDEENFAKISERFKKLLGEQFYSDETEVLADEKDIPLYYEGKKIYLPKKKNKILPFREQLELESLLEEKSNLDRFKRSRKKILKLTGFESNEAQLREGLAAFYGDYFEVKGGREKDTAKLTKIMSLNHPITMIRFNAADQKPYDDKRGIYDFHKLNGKPATYKKRSVELLKDIQMMLQAGDFASIYKLFDYGGKADRLYMDSIFFPATAISSDAEREGILYDVLSVNKKTGEKVQVMTSKIPKNYRSSFKEFEEPDTDRCRDAVKKYKRDEELNNLPPFLADDEQFLSAFEETARNKKIIAKNHDAMTLNEDGTVNLNLQKLTPEEFNEFRMMYPDKFQREGGDVKGVESVSPEELRLTKDTLEKIAKNSPLIAARAAQLNSIGLGYAVGGAELVGRGVMDNMKLPFQTATTFGKLYWKSLNWYSFMSIYVAATEFYEHVANLADFRMKFKAYTMLMNTFKGTILGSEFAKLQQAKENERVESFKGAFAQFGNVDIIDKITNPRDRFELKAAMAEGFDNRGLFALEDILRNDVFRSINRFTPNVIIPVDKYTDEQMQSGDPQIRDEMTTKVREALDDIWGTGQWYGWRSTGAQKYESNRKAAFDNFNNLSTAEKKRTYKEYWGWLKLPRDGNPLLNRSPAEIVGNIENDMQYGWLDSGETFALLQAMICKGYVRQEHIARFQQAHPNDIPAFAIMEPVQARLAGLTDIVQQELDADKPFDLSANNRLMLFFQGKEALPLNAVRVEGKWQFVKTQEDFDRAAKAGEVQKTTVTIQQVQKWREAQPESHRKTDNSSIGIFSSAYPWDQIENGLRPDAQGNIDARPHDIVAAYRGIHEEFASYMKALGNPELEMDDTEFKRGIYAAYLAISKTCAYGGFLARHISRKYDYDANLMDGSPNLENINYETRGSTGISNFEKLILGNTGPHQRMNESAKTLDNMDMSDELRYNFKTMAGYQFVQQLGVDPETGKTSNVNVEQYERDKFYPAKHFQATIKAFYDDVLEKAKKRGDGFYKSIKQSLDGSGMANFKLDNARRQVEINRWSKREAKLP